MKNKGVFAFALLFAVFASAFQLSAKEPSGGLDYGEPSKDGKIVDKTGFALSYSRNHLQPKWVAYRLTKEKVESKEYQRNNNYYQDRECYPGLVAQADYSKIGCHVGHMAPAQDMRWSKDAELECFYFSNMCPQLPNFNEGIWRTLEGTVRNFAVQEGSIFVITGPVLPRNIAEYDSSSGRQLIPIPEAFFKVVLDETPPKKMIGFIIPHKEHQSNVRQFVKTVKEVESRTGLTFFGNGKLTDAEKGLKNKVDSSAWKWGTKN